MSRKGKKSNRKVNPKTQKTATSITPKTIKDNNIVWDVSQIDDDGKWGWRRINCSFFFKEIWKKMLRIFCRLSVSIAKNMGLTKTFSYTG